LADAGEHVLHVFAPRRRRQADEPVHERLGPDRHVVGRDQDQDERAEDAGHVQPDRRERTDQPVGLVGVALEEALHLVAHLPGALAGDVRVDLLEVLDDRGHVVDELVRLIHERRDQEVDDEHEQADAGEQRHERADGARNPVALVEPLGGSGQRDRHHDGHEDRQQQRHELPEEQPEEEQPGSEQHGPVSDLR
jgi:hypothetical protein